MLSRKRLIVKMEGETKGLSILLADTVLLHLWRDCTRPLSLVDASNYWDVYCLCCLSHKGKARQTMPHLKRQRRFLCIEE